MSIYATSRPVRTVGEVRACARCGVERVTRKRTNTCRDCREVLTAEERLLWAV